jgi:hypothetical protein
MPKPPLIRREAGPEDVLPVRNGDTSVESGLKSIYADDDRGGMERLTQAHHSTAKKVMVALVVFLALLTAVSWAGFFLFRPDRGGFAGEQVTVNVDGPDTPKGAEPTTYIIRWENGEDVALGTASLDIRLPKEFRVIDSPLTSEGETATWKIGSIGPGKDGSLSIRGVYLAPVGKTLDLQVILSYRPSDFNSEFQKVATKSVTVTDSALALEISAPTRVLPGDKVRAEIRWRHEGEVALENIRVTAVLPGDFVLESTEPAADADDGRAWIIPTVEPGSSGVLVLNGSFAPEAEGTRDIKAQIGLGAEDGSLMAQAEATAAATVFKGDLVAALIVNGQSTDQAVRFGDVQRFAVTWKNTGTVPLEGIELTAVLVAEPSASLLKWNELDDDARGVRDGERLTWTRRQVPALARIEPDEGGTIQFELPLGPLPRGASSDTTYRVIASLEAKIGQVGDETVDRVVKTAPITARLLSDISLAAEARYFDADLMPVGTGPLPPKVGERTTYRVYWTVENSLHELTNLKMSAKLPAGVIWTGWSSVDAGNLKYDAASGKMAWSLNRLPTSVSSVTVAFDVGITPTDDQRGRPASLLDATILEATDKVTGDPIMETASPLTTALANDDAAVGKSKVQ